MQKKWWNDKICYQIYPKSFKDTNGDGIGDLKGVISKLDYLKDLGIDVIWLSPVYKTPYADQGYDIADYYAIDERFGTMEDMEELIKKAKERNMYILMDLVVNHCSDEHEWFKKACEDPDGKYGKYFYIRDIKNGEYPTNWRAYFGGTAWDKLSGHPDKCYLHLFHKKQPDLNWENKEVREEIYKNVNWWLEKGLGGFRIDAIINIKKADPMISYEPDREDNLSSVHKMLEDAHGIGKFLGELRNRCFTPHDAFTVGEVFDVKENELRDFISETGYFSTMFDFSTTGIGKTEKGWHFAQKPTPKEYIEAIFKSQNAVKDFAVFSNIIENHDEPRGVSHYIPEGEVSDRSKKLLAVINIMLRGIPFIYQGQEIGMENTKFTSIDDVDDISSKGEYNAAIADGLTDKEALDVISKYSRDNSRTPMQWDNTENAGFTTGKPWLKVNPNYNKINVEAQIKDNNSVYSFYKKLIFLRKSEEFKNILVYGDITRVKAPDNVMAFTREYDGKKVLIIANFQKSPLDFEVKNTVDILINNCKELKREGNILKLEGYQAVVLSLL